MTDSWCPLFSKIVDSSIWQEDDVTVKVFITMLAKKGADHVVRGNAFSIGRWSQKTESEVIKSLKKLSSPDTKRLEPQPHEGRRIQKVEGGWLILNGQIYEDEMRAMNLRMYKARKEREYRAKAKIEKESVPSGTGPTWRPKYPPTREERECGDDPKHRDM